MGQMVVISQGWTIFIAVAINIYPLLLLVPCIIGWWTSFHPSILDGISSKGRHMRSIFGMNSFTLINLLLTCTSTQGILCMFVARPSLFYSSHVVCWSPLMVRPHMDLLIKTTNLETPVTCGKKETTSSKVWPSSLKR